MKTLLFLAAAIISLNSCIKCFPGWQNDCEELKAGLISHNENLTKKTIEQFIARLEDQTYTEENLGKLVGLIQTNCSVNATIDCFNCIKTFPPMTELHLTVDNTGISKIIDLSYDASNKIVFKNLH